MIFGTWIYDKRSCSQSTSDIEKLLMDISRDFTGFIEITPESCIDDNVKLLRVYVKLVENKNHGYNIYVYRGKEYTVDNKSNEYETRPYYFGHVSIMSDNYIEFVWAIDENECANFSLRKYR